LVFCRATNDRERRDDIPVLGDGETAERDRETGKVCAAGPFLDMWRPGHVFSAQDPGALVGLAAGCSVYAVVRFLIEPHAR
jgi:hypothetical protein